ncbi:MAG TPA: DUF11 domain-containing protein [Usitatibacter sp.]|nr:DUF11 domain-containing protein [Usitatibacter sp.]
MARRCISLASLVSLLSFALLAGAAHAQQTALWYSTLQMTGTGYQRAETLLAPPDTFQFSNKSPAGLWLNASSATAGTVTLRMAPPTGQTFALGAYEQTTDTAARSPAGVLSMSIGSTSLCNTTGRFVILELAYDSNFDMVSLAADFELRCGDTATYGELRYNSTVPLTIDKPATAVAPDPFAFAPRGPVAAGTVVASDATTVYGIRSPAPVSIVGGEYSVNGGAFTDAAGTVSNRDRVVVRQTSSPEGGATHSATLTVGGVAGRFDVTTYMPGTPFTGVTLESATPGTFGNNLSSIDTNAPNWQIATYSSGDGEVDIQLTGPSFWFASIRFQAPLDAKLAAGPYEAAVRAPFNYASPGLDVSGNVGCFISTGRFVIHEIERNADGSIAKLAASFEQWCGTSAGPVHGEVRINSAVAMPWMLTAPRTSPYPFALSAQSPVRAGALVRSNITTIDGIDQPVPISIVGGAYSVNGGPFTSAPGTVNPRDDVVVQLTASRTPGAVRSATLTAGGRSATLSVSTYQPGMAVTGLYYQSTSGDFVGGGTTRIFLAPPSRLARAQSFEPNDMQLSLQGTEGHLWSATFTAPQKAIIVPGVYENATRWPFQDPAVPGLDFSGDGRGCNQLYGRFVVREAQYAADGTLQRFAADFEQHCETRTAPPLFGEVRYNSTVSFSALEGGECTTADPTCVTDLAVSQAVNVPAPRPGDELTFSVVVANMGTGIAHNVVVVDTLPPDATFVSAPAGCSFAAGKVTCVADAIANGSSITFNIVVRATSAGTLSNGVTASAEDIDSVSANNSNALTVPVAAPASVSALSTRMQVLTGDDVLIGGFVIGGTVPKTVAIRARGPSLAPLGIDNPLADPTLTVVRASDQAVIAINDDWGTDANATALAASGFAPGDSRESAVLMTLSPGAYTAVVSSARGANGVGMVEVYEVDHPEAPLVGLSTRGQVLRGNDVMIGGFIVQGARPQTVVVRGRGPSLAANGIANTLPDPILQLVRASDNTVIATNDDWASAANAAQLSASGFAPGHEKEAAVLITLDPGAYTAILSGVADATGVGIVEVFALP